MLLYPVVKSYCGEKFQSFFAVIDKWVSLGLFHISNKQAYMLVVFLFFYILQIYNLNISIVEFIDNYVIPKIIIIKVIVLEMLALIFILMLIYFTVKNCCGKKFQSFFAIIDEEILLGLVYISDKRAMSLFFILLLSYIILQVHNPYLLSPDESQIKNVFTWFSYRGISDKLIYSVLDSLSKLMGLAVPTSLTFYVFTYREQKQTGESTVNKNSTVFILPFFIGVTIFTSIYSLHLTTSLYTNLQENSLVFVTHNWDNFLILLILTFMDIYLGFVMVRNLFKNINLRWLLEDTIKDASIALRNLDNMKDLNPKFQENIYLRLCYLVESIYQMLISTVEKNMNDVYYQVYKMWSDLLKEFHNVDNPKYIQLLDKNPSKYIALYKSILKNHVILVTTLYNKNKIQECHKCVEDFLGMIPQTDLGNYTSLENSYRELGTVYYAVLYELSILLQKNEHIGLYPLLKRIEELAQSSIDKKNIIVIYRALIIKAVEKADVKVLSTLIYSLFRIIDINDNCGVVNYDNCKVEYSLECLIGEESEDLLYNTEEREISIMVLLQAALKSIEISHYGCTGFLVKYIANFDSSIWVKVYSEFCQVNGLYKGEEEELPLFKEVNVDFSINPNTSSYCLQKLTILFYGQQNYIFKSNILLSCVPIILVSLSKVKYNQLFYLLKKLQGAKDKYGLHFLKDEKFMKKLMWRTFRTGKRIKCVFK